MKIALLSNELYPQAIGGMQKHSYHLARNLAFKGIQVDVYFYEPENQEQKKQLLKTISDGELNNINFYGVEVPSSLYFPGHYVINSYRYSANIFNSLIKRLETTDFIYAQGFTALKLLKEKATLSICPPIGVNFHGLEMFQNPADLTANLKRYLFQYPANYSLRRADIAFSLGGKLTHLLTKRVGFNTEILETPIGIDKKWLIKDLKPVKNKRKFIFVGRYERRKGIQELQRVIKILNENYNFTFEFIGPIPEKNQLDLSNCKYYGALYDENKIKKIISSGDVLVCPSYSEGMPTVILEAMARGLAVIATDVGAVSELVSSETGWLIEPANEQKLKEALIQAIEISESNLCTKRMSAFNLIKDRFTWDTVVDKTLHQIENYLSIHADYV